jgi:hypothetical protein
MKAQNLRKKEQVLVSQEKTLSGSISKVAKGEELILRIHYLQIKD